VQKRTKPVERLNDNDKDHDNEQGSKNRWKKSSRPGRLAAEV